MYKQENYLITDSDLESLEIGSITGGFLDPILFSSLSPNQQDETMDVASKNEPEFQVVEYQPPHLSSRQEQVRVVTVDGFVVDLDHLTRDQLRASPRGPPERVVFNGALDFQVEINASDTHKRKYLYSNQLNRIYVDMGCNFSVQFRWNTATAPLPMYVRAIVVFSDDSYAEKRVERCTQHTYETGNNDLSQTIVKNVLHSAREMKTHGVYYTGNPDLADSWYSVLVEFPTMSPGPFTHAYKFVCKNSCPNGINRRAIDIIFNLEDQTGYVHGRQMVGARVCACPRRDMVRDEKDLKVVGTKRALPRTDSIKVDKSKKIKIEISGKSDDLVTLPPIQIVGVRAVLTGLEVMLSMMEQGAALKKNDPQAVEKYNKSISSLRSKIDELKGTKRQ